MNIDVEGKKVEKEFVTLRVRVAEGELKDLNRGAYLVVAQRNGVDLAGERTAREILEDALGAEEAQKQRLDALKHFVAPFALSADGGDYSVVGAPYFDEGEHLDTNGDMIFEATWVRLPELGLSSYDPVEISVPPIEVSEEELDAHMREIADSYKTVERDKGRSVVEDGAVVQISMECLKDGERMPQVSFKNRLYRAGSGQMPEGFDESIMGAKVGDTVHVDFMLPAREELDGTMSGPSIVGEVKIEAIMRERDRVLTDEFVANNIPNVSSLAELREQSRREIEQKKSEQHRHMRNFAAAGELAKRLVGSIPDSAFDAVADQMMETLREQAHAEHVSVDELLRAQGSNEDQYRMMSLMQARTQLRQGAALDAWARHFGITVNDADIDAFFASSAPKAEQAAQMRGEVERGGMAYLAREGALRLKVSEDVVAHAIVRESAPEDVLAAVQAESGR